MKIRVSTWDERAPLVYLFAIGLAIGFVLGFAVGGLNGAGAESVYTLLAPAIAIAIALITLALIARKMKER